MDIGSIISCFCDREFTSSSTVSEGQSLNDQMFRKDNFLDGLRENVDQIEYGNLICLEINKKAHGQ